MFEAASPTARPCVLWVLQTGRPREVLFRKDMERRAGGQGCLRLNGAETVGSVILSPRAPHFESAPQEGATLQASRGRRFWLLSCPGDKAWDLFSLAVAQERDAGPPAPRMQVQSPAHRLSVLRSRRSPWPHFFRFELVPETALELGSRACLSAPPHHPCALLLARQETLPTWPPSSPT